MEMALNMGAFEALDNREMMEVDGGIRIFGSSLGGLASGAFAGAAVGTVIGGVPGFVVGFLVGTAVTWLYDSI